MLHASQHTEGSDFWYGNFILILSHNLFVGDKLQNSNNARQGIRLSTAVYRKLV